MPKHTLPDSSRKLIANSIQQIFDKLKIRLLGPFSQSTSSVVEHVTHNKTVSLPGVYINAYQSGKSTKTPDHNQIQSLASVTDQHIQATAEKFKANTFATIEQKLRDASDKVDYDFETDLNDALLDIFDSASTSTKQILETELHRTKSIAVTDSAVEFAKEQGDDNPTLFFLTRMDARVCKICKGMYEHSDQTPVLYKQSELSHSYYDKDSQDPVYPPNAHPNCLLNGDARVLTDKGYVPVKLLKTGDLVLTHKNRYKPILGTLSWYTTPYKSDYYSVNINHNAYGINITPDHALLTSDGFKPIKDIKDSKVMTLQKKCSICDKYTLASHPTYFCGPVCRDKFLEDPIALSKQLVQNPDYVLRESVAQISHHPSTLPTMLYDITVDVDHSFVVNGIVSKNCRCLALYLPRGTKVLPGGHMEYVGDDYDQYEEQRGLKKTVLDLAAFFNHECDHDKI